MRRLAPMARAPVGGALIATQDMVLVTDGAPELLSAKFNTDEAFVIA